MSYIEEHLTEDIDYSKVSKIAYCSEYHFKRMFSFFNNQFYLTALFLIVSGDISRFYANLAHPGKAATVGFHSVAGQFVNITKYA